MQTEHHDYRHYRLTAVRKYVRRSSMARILFGSFVILAFVGALWLSLARYRGYNMGSFDLGHISQAIWSATQGEPLVWTVHGIAWSRLGQHVELIYFLLAPLYALWPSPQLLLVVQAAAYALAALPVYRLARRHLGSEWPAVMVALIYLSYPVAQTAVLFEFHADTLAMSFLLFAIEAADRRVWCQYALWIALAVASKFYVAAPVAIMGLVLWWKGERRAGLLTTLGAALWGVIAFFVVRQLFQPVVTARTAATAAGFLRFYFLEQFSDIWITIPARFTNGVIVLGPALLLIWRAPLWLLPGAIVVAAALVSNGPGPSYDYRFHHYALAVPFLMAAAVYGAASMRSEDRGGGSSAWKRRLRLSLLLTLTFSFLLVDTPLSPMFYFASAGSGRGLDDTGYRVTNRDRFKNQWLATNVPEKVPLAVNVPLGYPLVNRLRFYRLNMKFSTLPERLPELDYVVADALHDLVLVEDGMVVAGGVRYNYDAIRLLLGDDGFELVEAQDGLLLFARQSRGLAQQLTLVPATGTVRENESIPFGDAIGLVDSEIESLGGRRYRARFDWITLRSMSDEAPLIAVSQPGELPFARIPHLPTLAILPTPEWPVGQVVRETFEFELPEETPPGTYPLRVGWYDTSSVHAAHTDERSRVGDLYELGTLEVPE